MKKLYGATDKATGEFVEYKMEGNIRLEPYKIGRKVVWMSNEHAGRVEEEVVAHNIAAKEATKRGIVTHRKRITIEDDEGRKKVSIIEDTDEINKKIAQKKVQSEREKMLKKIYKEDYTQATKAFMAKLDVVAGGMQTYLRDKSPEAEALKKELEKLVRKVNKMTPEERIKFYEENYELFADMSDYYQWLKRHSGHITPTDRASLRYSGMTVESYMKKNINSVKRLNKKLDDYV